MNAYSMAVSLGAFFMTVSVAASDVINNLSNSTQPNLERPLDAGSISGISVGGIIGGALLVGGIYCCCRVFCGRGVATASAAGATAGLLAGAAPAPTA